MAGAVATMMAKTSSTFVAHARCRQDTRSPSQYRIVAARFDLVAQQLLVAGCGLLIASGCFCFGDREPAYGFELHGDLVWGGHGGGSHINWGGASDDFVVSADLARVYVAAVNVALGGQELLEFYGGPEPLNLAGVVARGVRESEDCPHDEVDYDITMLPPGEYTMVHRRSSAPEGFEAYYGDVTWMTWEGEDALVTTIVRQP